MSAHLSAHFNRPGQNGHFWTPAALSDMTCVNRVMHQRHITFALLTNTMTAPKILRRVHFHIDYNSYKKHYNTVEQG